MITDFTLYLKDIDKTKMEIKKVNNKNLHNYYNNIHTNIYVNGEIVDGFDEKDIRIAINNKAQVVAVSRHKYKGEKTNE